MRSWRTRPVVRPRISAASFTDIQLPIATFIPPKLALSLASYKRRAARASKPADCVRRPCHLTTAGLSRLFPVSTFRL
jgi:hypothetical protein